MTTAGPHGVWGALRSAWSVWSAWSAWVAWAIACAPVVAGAATWEPAKGTTIRVQAHLLTTSFAGIDPASGALPRRDLALTVLRLRPTAEVSHTSGLRLEAAWDVAPVLGSGTTLQQLALPPANRLRRGDPAAPLYDGQSYDITHNLDRFAVDGAWGAWRLRAGRQAIGHGSARLLPSADLFSPFGPGAIATEYKRGVDALRVGWSVGDRLECEVFAVAHRAAEAGEPADTGLADGIYLARAAISWADLLDLSVLAGISYRLPTLAWGINGDVAGAGWYVEGSARWDGAGGDRLLGSSEEAGKLQLRATAGLDRQWPTQTRTLLEASFQSTGGDELAGMVAASGRLPLRVGEAFLVGRWHAAALVSQPWRDIHALHIAAIVNLQDGSALVLPSATISVADEVSLGVGALLGLGKRPTQRLGPIVLPRSEFGSAPWLGYLDVRVTW